MEETIRVKEAMVLILQKEIIECKNSITKAKASQLPTWEEVNKQLTDYYALHPPNPEYVRLRKLVEENPVHWAYVRAKNEPPRIVLGVPDPSKDYTQELPEAYKAKDILLEYEKFNMNDIQEF